MSVAALENMSGSLTGPGVLRLPPVPWRDPQTVSPKELATYIGTLQAAAALEPRNADLRTCLGMAHAMNYDVYKSMDALEEARRIDPANFIAQLKYAELQYRLRALDRAEQETLAALNLAENSWHVSLARKQLSDIRQRRREGTQKPAWTKSLALPALLFVLLFAALCAIGAKL